MSRKETLFITPIFLLFTMHGLLYYAFPEYQYLSSDGNSGWISYIKYACILVALPALARTHFNINSLKWALIGSIILTLTLMSNIRWSNNWNILLLQFQIPILGYFFAPYLINFFSNQKRAKYILVFALIVTAISMTIEFIVGGIFGQYSRSGFRGTGPFVNPNNSGVVIALTATGLHFITKSIRSNILILAISISIILLSGSKTAMALYLIGAFFALNMASKLATTFIALSAIILLATSIPDAEHQLGLRDFSLESGEVRKRDTDAIVKMINSAPLPEIIFGFSTRSLVDNAYLDMISYGGLYLFAIFATAQLASILICVRLNLLLPLTLHLLLFLAMLTTNIPRLWPTAYIYWALVGFTMLRATNRTPVTQRPISKKPQGYSNV